MVTGNAQHIEWRFLLAILALGLTSLITQIILLREFLAVFYGNELVIGIILGNWMILTGVGSYFGRFADRSQGRVTLLFACITLLAVLPVVTVFFLRLLRNIVFPVGSMIGIVEILYSSFVLLLPYCLVSGGAFTLLASVISARQGTNLITSVYGWEAVGSVAGGLMLNLVMVWYLNAFQILIFMMVFNIVVALALAVAYLGVRARYLLALVSLVFLAPALLFNLDELTRGFLFVDQEIAYAKDTPYGSVVVTKQANQLNFFENNILLCSTDDVTTSEEAVHYAMIQHPNPRTVLLVSGAISGATQEIVKYNVEGIDYVELNPWLIDVARKYTATLSNEKVHVIAEDARLYVRRAPRKYDIALINVPAPSTAQLNRYYTAEFFAELKEKLNPGAVVSLGLLSATDYSGEGAREINSVVYATLKSAFKNVLIVPGLKTYFLASDRLLRIDVAALIEARGIRTTYVNQYYLDDRILQQRSALIEKSINKGAMVNTDFTPISYYRQVAYWLSFFKSNYWILILVCMVALAFAAINFNVISIGMFTGGFAASSIEILLLISFQIIYGYVYQIVGIIITIFMAGLALGSLWSRKRLPHPNIRHYIAVQFAIGVYSALLPLWLILLRNVATSPFVVHSIFFVLTLGIAVVIGIEFSVASQLRQGTVTLVASEIYSIDLMGSAIGAVIVTAYLMPMMGIMNVSMLVGLLSFISGTVLIIKRKKFVPY
ncbi:MAG: fused MFS/spermidine synthase [Bacteroidota bacterium]